MKNVCIVTGSLSLLCLTTPGVARAQMGMLSPVEAGTRTSDVFLGQNKTGPYTLAWKNVRAEGVVVVVDGATLGPEAYTLDAAKGTITFRDRLKPQSAARVDYAYDPLKAQRNVNPAGSPVTVSLLDRKGAAGDASLQVTALPGDPKKPGGGPLLVWGLSGKTSLLGGGLSSQLLLSPDAPDGGGGGLMDRAGVTLGYGAASEKTRVDVSFQRSGKEFAPHAGRSFGMAEQAQRWALGAQAKPVDWFSAELRVGGARDLAGKGATGQNTMALRLFGTGAAPALSLARSEDTRHAADGAATAVTTEKIGLTGKVGRAASYSAQGQRTTTDGPAGGKGDARDELSVALSAATLDKKLSVAASGGTKETATGVEARQQVQVKVQPRPTVTLSAEARRQTVTPQDGAETRETTYRAATAELTPFQNAKLTGSLKINGEGDERKSVAEVAAEAKTLRYVGLTGGITNRADTGADLLDTARVGMSLRPLPGLSLTGGLTVNPEDKGTVRDATRQEYALAARLGALELGGGYSLTTFAQTSLLLGTAEQTGELSLNIGLNFSRFTRLTGGYKDSFAYGADDPLGTRVYALGLSHNLGSAFNFSFGGSLTENKASVGLPADVKAEAKLGLKF